MKDEDLEDVNYFLDNRCSMFSKTTTHSQFKKHKVLAPLSEKARFMAKYLKETAVGSSCSSWDFEADYAFASEFGQFEIAEFIQSCMNSNVCFAHIIGSWHSSWKKSVTSPRLTALRELTRHGYVEASWTGLGEGSKNQWGVTRIRSYRLLHSPEPMKNEAL